MLKIHCTVIFIILMINYCTSQQPYNYITNGDFQLPVVKGQGVILNNLHNYWNYQDGHLVPVKYYNKRWPNQESQVLHFRSYVETFINHTALLGKGEYTLEMDYSANQGINLQADCTVLILVKEKTVSYQTTVSAASYDLRHLKVNFTVIEANSTLHIRDMGKCWASSIILDNVVVNKIPQKPAECHNLLVNGNFEEDFSSTVPQNGYFRRIYGWLSFGTIKSDAIYDDNKCNMQSQNHVLTPQSSQVYQMIDIAADQYYWIEIDYKLASYIPHNEYLFWIHFDRELNQIFAKKQNTVEHTKYVTSVSKGMHAFIIKFAYGIVGDIRIDNVVLRKYQR